VHTPTIPIGTFALDSEWGIAGDDPQRRSPFVFPCVAQLTDFGTCLVVDRCLPANVLVEVTLSGSVEWIHRSIPRMNFAHRLNERQVLYLNGRSIFLVDDKGRSEKISSIPGTESFNCGSVLGQLLALGSDDGIDIVSIQGDRMGHVSPDEARFVEPIDVQLLSSGGLLITDWTAASVVELDAEGRRSRIFGRWRDPGRDDARLGGPMSACRMGDGRTIVADWRTHRLVEFDANGTMVRTLPTHGRARLFAPSYVREVGDDRILVVESGGRRVHIRDLDGNVFWEYGPSVLPEPVLSFPRSAEPDYRSEDLLICDSYGDRVIKMSADGHVGWEVGRDAGIRLPRAAAFDLNGGSAIADGINHRLLLTDSTGSVMREVSSVWKGGYRQSLKDPHHAAIVDGEYMLIVDSDLNLVIVIDDTNHVVAQWDSAGASFSDPHYAQLLGNGSVVVADSGNDRIVVVDRHGYLRREITHTINQDGQRTHLRYPRFASILADGSLLTVDTHAARIVRTDNGGNVVWQLGPTVDVG
jgi:hypothetical protein